MDLFDDGVARALHATHLSTGDRLWSTFPSLRPVATITHDTLDWYGWDEDGVGVHDVIGTRVRPLYQPVFERGGIPPLLSLEFDARPRDEAESATRRSRGSRSRRDERIHVHWFYGFTRDAHQYFMKASPVRPHAIRSRSRSIGRPSARWPAGSHHCRTNILARMEPGEGPIRLIRGSLAPVMVRFGGRRSGTCPMSSAAPRQTDHPLRYINRLFSASSRSGMAGLARSLWTSAI
jgi:hypothetical protein